MILIFLLYVFVMQIILPLFPEDYQDLLFLSRWDLFSNGGPSTVKDITLDNSQRYLLRDHPNYLRQQNINTVFLFKTLQIMSIEKVKETISSLDDETKGKIQIDTLKGDLYEHFILKKPLKVINKQRLYK